MTKRPPARWSTTAVGRAKPVLLLLLAYPLLRWVWLATQGGLGVHPQEFLTRSSGLWSLAGLLLTLTVTPLQRLLNQPALISLRRMLGLGCFFYTVLHVLAWAVWDRDGSVYAMWQDVLTRNFITVGAIATLPLVALATTSTRGWMRRLGRNWKRLHRTIYLIAILSIGHFWLVRAGKNDFQDVYAYAASLAVLLALRIKLPSGVMLRKDTKKAANSKPENPGNRTENNRN